MDTRTCPVCGGRNIGDHAVCEGSLMDAERFEAQERAAEIRELEEENAEKSQQIRDIWDGYRQRGEEIRNLVEELEEAQDEIERLLKLEEAVLVHATSHLVPFSTQWCDDLEDIYTLAGDKTNKLVGDDEDG